MSTGSGTVAIQRVQLWSDITVPVSSWSVQCHHVIFHYYSLDIQTDQKLSINSLHNKTHNGRYEQWKSKQIA